MIPIFKCQMCPWFTGYRNNANKRPLGHCDFAGVKRRPGALTVWPARLLKNTSGLLASRGNTKEKEKQHTSLTRTQQQLSLVLVLAQDILYLVARYGPGLGLQMIRALNVMWAFDLSSARGLDKI